MKYLLLIGVMLLLCTNCVAQNADIDLLRWINNGRDPSLDVYFKLITDYTAPLAYSTPFFLYGYARIKGYELMREKSVFVIQSMVLSWLLSKVLKHIFNRTRPYITYAFIHKLTTGETPSFPSGHTSDAFTMAASLSFTFPRWYVIIPSFAWAALVGYSRMDLGVHYPTDVLAGAIIGAGVPFALYYQKRRWQKRALKTDPSVETGKKG